MAPVDGAAGDESGEDEEGEAAEEEFEVVGEAGAGDAGFWLRFLDLSRRGGGRWDWALLLL